MPAAGARGQPRGAGRTPSSSDWPELRPVWSGPCLGRRAGGRPWGLCAPQCGSPVFREASALPLCCLTRRRRPFLLEQGQQAGSGPSQGSGHLCPQFLDLMETIDKQRKEMARSSR